MRTLKLFISLNFLSFVLFAQNSRYIQVSYNINFLVTKNSIAKANKVGVLVIDSNNSSNYALIDLIKRDSLSNVNWANYTAESKRQAFREAFFFEFRELIKKDYSLKKYDVTCWGSASFDFSIYSYQQKEELNWKIEEGSDTLLNYPCNKATLSYMGRNYEAWYTPEIPIFDGPWKFSGLPGLILKINDDENHFTFTAIGIENTNFDRTQNLFQSKSKIIKTTHEAYFKDAKFKRENPNVAMKAIMGNSTFNGISIDDPNSPKLNITFSLENEYKKY